MKGKIKESKLSPVRSIHWQSGVWRGGRVFGKGERHKEWGGLSFEWLNLVPPKKRALELTATNWMGGLRCEIRIKSIHEVNSVRLSYSYVIDKEEGANKRTCLRDGQKMWHRKPVWMNRELG